MAMMPVEMLKKLGSGIRPEAAQKSRGPDRSDTIDFGALVAAARAGRVRSDRPAAWERGEHCDDLERCRGVLEEAMDRAEAAGVGVLIVALQGVLLRAEIASRSVEELDTDSASVLSLDPVAFLMLRVDEESVGDLEELSAIESGTRSAKRVVPAGMGWISNRSLGEIVAKVGSSAARRED